MNILSKISFKTPIQQKILIHDNEGADLIKELILGDEEASILNVRGEGYTLGPKVLMYILLSLHRIDFKFIKYKKFSQYPLSFLGQFYRLYLLACVKCVAPKIIITFTDDDYSYGWLVRNYTNAKFFAIQNGARYQINCRRILPPVPQEGSTFYLDTFFCFGEYEKDLLDGLGHSVKNYFPVGSIKGRLAMKKFSTLEKKYDVCVVSCFAFHIMIGGTSPRAEFKSSMHKFHKLLGRTAKELKLSLCITLRENSPEEKAFYQEYYEGSNYTLIDRVDEEYSSYRSMYQSTMCMGQLSTMIREYFGAGNKILISNFTGDEAYDFPARGVWSLHEYDEEVFKERVKTILEMPHEEFLKISNDAASYVMSYDSKALASDLIKEEVFKYL